jgi:hypothetical protein
MIPETTLSLVGFVLGEVKGWTNHLNLSTANIQSQSLRSLAVLVISRSGLADCHVSLANQPLNTFR